MPRIRSYKWDYLADRALDRYLRDKPAAVAFDTETTGVEWHDTAFCVTVAWGDEAHYIELGDEHRESIAALILKRPLLVCHNAKFDLQKTIAAGLLERDSLDGRIEDTLAIAHLLDEHQNKQLKKLAQVELGLTTNEDEHLKVVRRQLKLKKDDGYAVLPRPVLVPYAIKDAAFTYKLWAKLRPRLAKHSELVDLYEQEMALTLVLHDMEAAGMAVDLAYVKRMARDFGERIAYTENAIAGLVGRDDFNPNSPKQIQEAFANRGVKVDSTAVDVLEKLDDDLAKGILSLRKSSKLRSTYLVPMLKEQRGGIIHPNFRQFGTVTGRMSSGAAAA